MRDVNEILSRDVARKIKSFLETRNDFFAFSGVNRKLRSIFASEREEFIKRVKIRVKELRPCSFLHTCDGELYASGDLLPGKSGNLRQWTRIGPLDQKISDFSFSENTHDLYVQCKEEWYQLGKEISDWRKLIPPNNQTILKLVLSELNYLTNSFRIYIHCTDEKWYFCESKNLALTDWKIFETPSEKMLDFIQVSQRENIVKCEDGWYEQAKDASSTEAWIKIGPPDKKVLKLQANNLNIVVYCDDGHWYATGANYDGQLGIGSCYGIGKRWILLGPEGKEVKSVFLFERKIFLYCQDGLYGAGKIFDTDAAEKLETWTKLGFENTDIFEIRTAKNAIFVRASDAWYHLAGDARTGVFGVFLSEYNWYRWEWVKLSCEGKEIEQLVSSHSYVFASCKDAWYFTGSNACGQNGMNDDILNRAQWIKLFSHGNEIEVLERNREEKNIRFRRALKKLYEPETLLSLQKVLCEVSCPSIYICYHVNYLDQNTLYFLPPFIKYYRFLGANSRPDHDAELGSRIREILDYPYVKILKQMDFSHCIGAANLPHPYCWALVSHENYEALCHFLKIYEDILDHKIDVSEVEPMPLPDFFEDQPDSGPDSEIDRPHFVFKQEDEIPENPSCCTLC